jgi:hypothetical protein
MQCLSRRWRARPSCLTALICRIRAVVDVRLSAVSGPRCDIDPALSNVRMSPRSASSIGTLARWSDLPGGPDQRRHCIGDGGA